METKTRTVGLPHNAEGPRMLHFVGFRDDRYHNAIRVFGQPDFVHQRWDWRTIQELTDGDTIIFATGDETKPLARYSYDDSSFF